MTKFFSDKEYVKMQEDWVLRNIAERDSRATTTPPMINERERREVFAYCGANGESRYRLETDNEVEARNPAPPATSDGRVTAEEIRKSNWDLEQDFSGPTFSGLTFVSPATSEVESKQKAVELLNAARDIMIQRGKDYDNPQGERSMEQIVNAFNAITRQDMTEAQGWLFMLVLKMVRQWQAKGYHQDSAEDGIAYSALLAECLSRGGAK